MGFALAIWVMRGRGFEKPIRSEDVGEVGCLCAQGCEDNGGVEQFMVACGVFCVVRDSGDRPAVVVSEMRRWCG